MATVLAPVRSKQDVLNEALGMGIGNFIESGSKAYQNSADQAAIQNAIEKLPPNATPQDYVKALTSTKLYNQASIQKPIENFIGLEKATAIKQKAQDKLAADARKKELDRFNAEVILNKRSDLTPEEKQDLLDKGITAATAKSLTESAPYETESSKLDAKRVHEYQTGVEDASKTAEEDLRALDTMLVLKEAGAGGFKIQDAFADYMKGLGFEGAEAFKNPIGKTFNSIAKSQMQGLADIVKGKVSNFEFGIFRDMLARAEDSPKAIDAMIEERKLIRKINVEENKIMQDIISEYADKGLPKPPNLAYLTSKRLKPIADELTREATNRLENILVPKEANKYRNINKEILDSVRNKKVSNG